MPVIKITANIYLCGISYTYVKKGGASLDNLLLNWAWHTNCELICFP